MIVSSTFSTSLMLRSWRGATDTYDKAGLFTKQYLSKEEVSKVVVVGSEIGSLFRSLFYLDNPNSTLASIPEGSTYDLSNLPTGKEWILVIGNHPLPNNTSFQLQLNGFTLARVAGTYTIDFKISTWPGIISMTQGLSSAEAWGTWSSGNVVTLEFCTPLPEKFSVHLDAGAFGPNIGKEFVAHVGDSAVGFTLPSVHAESVLNFSNPRRVRTITIDIPSPISPKKLGLSADERNLGMALFELRIEPR
jgi:phosphoglycerol transferase